MSRVQWRRASRSGQAVRTPGDGFAGAVRRACARARQGDGSRILLGLGSFALLLGLALSEIQPAAAMTMLVTGLALVGSGIAGVTSASARPDATASELARFRDLGDRLEHNIERLKDIQWELTDSESRYRDLLDSQNDLITRSDAAGTTTFVNRAFCRAFGVTPATVLGKPFDLDARRCDGEAVPPPGEGGRRVCFEMCLTTIDGPRWIAFEQIAITDENGRLKEVQRLGRDITEQRRVEAELARSRDQAEAANRAKSRFLAAMSHEIRTPMNGILGMTGLIAETPLSAEQRSYVEAVQHSAKNLLTIIDEILDLSKIEAGKLELHTAPFHLAECVQSVVELLSTRAAERSLDLAWRIDPDIPRLVTGDETRIRQVLLNLIGNAIKFTDRGGVAIRVRRGTRAGPTCPRADDEPERFPVLIEVTDTGAGIPPHLLPGLFSEFEQVDEVANRRRSGTGLGLAISRRLVQGMDGDIEVESEVGVGSTFTARMVLTTAEAASDVLHRPPCEDGRFVLIVSKRPLQRSIMQETLLSLGIPSETHEPDEALAAIGQAGTRGRAFDTLIADAELGVETVAGLVQAVRAASGEEATAILVCDQTGRRMLDAFRSTGCRAYLVRPVRPTSLLAQISRSEDAALDPAPPQPHPAPVESEPSATAEAPCRRILLVEDNDINALLARRMSERAGCMVHHAPSGSAALAYCEELLAGDHDAGIDIVLMDIHMPEMDGFEVTRRIKRLFAARGRTAPPIVALTANAFAEDRKRCFEAGLDDYLAKPFDRAELEAVLERWCPSDSSPRDGRLDGRAA